MKAPSEMMADYAASIIERQAHWMDILENGCNDPYWPDGCNMNLTRNHMIYYKRKIAELYEETGEPKPGEYYIPLPPEVNDRLMCNQDQADRMERIKKDFENITTKKPKYDAEQLSFL